MAVINLTNAEKRHWTSNIWAWVKIWKLTELGNYKIKDPKIIK